MKTLKTFSEFINESSGINSKGNWFHGSSTKNIDKIINSKYLMPGNKTGNSSFIPIKDRIYLSTDIHYSIIYLLGGDLAGNNHIKEGKGYLFVINPLSYKGDIIPDEDALGEMICNKKPKWLYDYAKKFFENDYEFDLPEDLEEEMEFLGLSLFQMIMNGDYISWPFAGKELLDDLSNTEIRGLLKYTNNFSVKEKIKFKEVWEFDYKNTKKLKADGSNFFELSKKIYG